MSKTNFNSIQFDGDSVKVGSTTTVTVTAYDSDGNVTVCKGASVPSAEAGYAIGCEHTDTATGAKYVNTGTASSCSFVADDPIGAADFLMLTDKKLEFRVAGNYINSPSATSLTVVGSAGASGTTQGTDISVTAGAAGATSGDGGDVNLTGGASHGASNTGGNLTLTAGANDAGNGGAVNITAGEGTGSAKFGGNVVISAGNCQDAGTGGNLMLYGGNDEDNDAKQGKVIVVRRPNGEAILSQYVYTLTGAVANKCFVEVNSSAQNVVGTVDSDTVIGVNVSGGTVTSDDCYVADAGVVKVTAQTAINSGEWVKCGTAGKAMPFLSTALKGLTMATVSAGGNFGNQPSNDSVAIVSDSASDTMNATIYGTTNGVDTLVSETIAITGVTPVTTTKINWGLILGIELSGNAVGTITFTKTSGGGTITTITAGNASAGVQALTGDYQRAFNAVPTINAGGASTKQVGLIGLNTAGAAAMDSQALDGTNVTAVNAAFSTVTKILFGDVATGSAVTLKTRATADDFSLCVGKARSTAAAAADCLVKLI